MRKCMLLTGCLMLLAGTVFAQDFGLNPQPQEMKVDAAQVVNTTRFSVKEGAEGTARSLLEELLEGKTGKGGTEVLIGTKADKALRKYKARIPDHAEGYYLSVSPDRIVLAGHDERGTYYAVQTLRRLLNGGLPSDSLRPTLPTITITDFPDVPFRGIVEGFYGTPWSFEARKRLLKFSGENKLNTYIYGPKDDPYHSTPNWRKPYPAKEAEQLKELISCAHQNEVDFVWAIHPGQDIQWNAEDLQNVLAKFESMYQLGVRAFAVFFDDISGEGTNAIRQAELLNSIDSLFIRPKKEEIQLIMCPTEYNRSWSNPAKGYLTTLGKHLYKNIRVMWTGERVVADMNQKDLAWIRSQIERPAYVWWNYPVSDYVRDHLLMGPVYGNEKGIASLMSGFMSNPMEHAEASKIALYGVADYTWNMEAFDSQKNWKQAIQALVPDAAEAFAVFCKHNADTGPNGHRYRRTESVDIQPVTEAVLNSLRAGAFPNKHSAALIAQEFEQIADAADLLLTSRSNPWMIAEIKPWLYQFRLLGNKGTDVLKMASALEQGDTLQFLRKYHHLKALEQLSYELSQTYNQNPYQPGVQTGSRVLQPFVDTLFTKLTTRFNATYGTTLDASGRYLPYKLHSNVVQLRDQPLQARLNTVSISPLLEVIRWDAGQYLRIDLDDVCQGVSLQINLGEEKGVPAWGKLEVSPDGKNWIPLTYEAGKHIKQAVKAIRLTNATADSVQTKLKKFSVTTDKSAGH